jgi:type IV secretory pathway VirB4 component
VLQAAYPFLAAPGLGSDGVYVGTDCCTRASFVFDPWVLYRAGVLTNPNLLLLGELGTGKSTLAKTLAVRSIAFGRRVYVPGDSKGEWGVVARAVGGVVVQLGRGLPHRLNPLDAAPRPSDRSVEEWTREVDGQRRELLAALAEVGLHRRITPLERTALDIALQRLSRSEASPSRRPTPTLADLVEALLTPELADASLIGMTVDELAAHSRSLTLELRRMVQGDLAGLFDGPTTTQLDVSAPMVVLDLSRIHGSDEAIALLSTCASAWLEQAVADPRAGLRYVVYDEAWRLMRLLPIVRRMQAGWKLSRAHGTANVLIMHRLSDLTAVGDDGSEAVALARGLLADAATRVVYAQEPDQLPATAALLGLTDMEVAAVATLGKGHGLWKVGRYSFAVHNRISTAERQLTNTDMRMAEGP